MDKISKALDKLSKKERILIKNILTKLVNNLTLDLNIQKLKTHSNIFRVRKGKLRIIFVKDNDQIKILAIERRSEKTYRDY